MGGPGGPPKKGRKLSGGSRPVPRSRVRKTPPAEPPVEPPPLVPPELEPPDEATEPKVIRARARRPRPRPAPEPVAPIVDEPPPVPSQPEPLVVNELPPDLPLIPPEPPEFATATTAPPRPPIRRKASLAIVLIAVGVLIAAVATAAYLHETRSAPTAPPLAATLAPTAAPETPSATVAITEPVSEECGNAALFADARKDDPDARTFLLRTAELCKDVPEWVAALKLHPGALHNTDAAQVVDTDVRTVCQGTSAKPDSAVCKDAESRGLLTTNTTSS